MNRATSALVTICILIFTRQISQGSSATWAQTPPDNNWSNPSNWMPNTVPNSTTDVATFGISDTTAISILAPINLANVTFEAGASAFAITVANNQTLTLWGNPCIVNNSGLTQEFVAEGGTIYFNAGSPDATTHFDLLGGDSTHTGGGIWFQGSSNAGAATFDCEGSNGLFPAGEVVIFDPSNAGSATFILHRGVNHGLGGRLTFEGGGAASANITCEGSDFNDRNGGVVTFANTGDAGSSTITVNGSEVAGGLPAVVSFEGNSNASSATIVAEGTTRTGGAIRFSNESTGQSVRIITNGSGSLDISALFPFTGITIGSLEGQRKSHVFLGSKKLSIGSNNTSTVYSGVIQDGGLSGGTGGSLAKVGTRTLTLSGANLYTGGTTVTQGDFLVANRTGSATGTGPVQVDAGRIGGAGTIAGALTIGTGSGSGATLIPAAGTKKEVTTTIQGALTLKADATYNCAVNTITGASDSVVANGVTIDPSATFVLHSKENGTLPPGTVITSINNTAGTAIAGNFNGLAEGSTITAGNNTYRVSYIGGDGNDFTLTVL